MKKKWTIQILCMLGILLMFSSCYHRRAHHQMHAAMVEYSNKQLDSISFSTTHHYTNKFNFLVFKDSLELIAQQPEEFLSNLPIDSFAVQKNCLLVVTDIRMVPQDSIDSVWVQLATEDNQFGWTRESRLLPKVVPDDPISEFIMTFSNTHLLIFMVIIILIAVAYTVRKIFHSNGNWFILMILIHHILQRWCLLFRYQQPSMQPFSCFCQKYGVIFIFILRSILLPYRLYWAFSWLQSGRY